MTDPLIIVGGGTSGMFTALLLRVRYPDTPIKIIEQSPHPGGLYTSIDYGKAGYFDYGMHILYDTGIPEVDALMHGLLPEKEWHILEGNRKDIAGIFWNGALQQHSPYIDLRRLSKSDLELCRRELYAAAQNPAPGPAADAATYLKARFGEAVAAHLSRVIKKLYQAPAHEVSAIATRQPTMDRVLLENPEQMEPILQSEALRARIGYPDQLRMPPLRNHHQCGRYPKRFGMIHVVNALHKRLLEENVTFLFNSRIEQVSLQDNKIQKIVVKQGNEPTVHETIAKLYWTAGWAGLANLLHLPVQNLDSMQAKAAHIHLRFNQPPDMGELYHFYCFDAGYKTFRVTNYARYCPAARNDIGYPVCVEYWPEEKESPDKTIENGIRELTSFGVIHSSHKLNFSAVQKVPNHHRLFMLSTVQAIEKTRQEIHRMNITNLSPLGVLAENGELLLYEILRDAYRKI